MTATLPITNIFTFWCIRFQMFFRRDGVVKRLLNDEAKVVLFKTREKRYLYCSPLGKKRMPHLAGITGKTPETHNTTMADWLHRIEHWFRIGIFISISDVIKRHLAARKSKSDQEKKDEAFKKEHGHTAKEIEALFNNVWDLGKGFPK